MRNCEKFKRDCAFYSVSGLSPDNQAQISTMSATNTTPKGSPSICFYCGIPGHKMHNCHTRKYHQSQTFVEGEFPYNTLLADVQNNIDVPSETFLQNRQNTDTNMNNANISTISLDPDPPRPRPRKKFFRELNPADFKINTQNYPKTPNYSPSEQTQHIRRTACPTFVKQEEGLVSEDNTESPRCTSQYETTHFKTVSINADMTIKGTANLSPVDIFIDSGSSTSMISFNFFNFHLAMFMAAYMQKK